MSFSPATSVTLTGTLSVNDGVTGSPQTVSLNGPGAASGTPVLTGMCTGTTVSGGQCGAATDLADCPAGEAAINPTNTLCGNAVNYVNIDNSRGCTVKTRTEEIPERKMRHSRSLCIVQGSRA